MYKTIAKLIGNTERTIFAWKKENRPIVKLIETYFTKDDLEEFLKTNKIQKMELLKKVENDIYSSSIELLSIFHELKIVKSKDTDLFIAQIFLEPKNAILTLTSSHQEWKEYILKNNDDFELNKLIELVIKYEFLTKYYNILKFSHNNNMENIINLTLKIDDINLINNAIRLYIFYKLFKFAQTSLIPKSKVLNFVNSIYDKVKLNSKNKDMTQHIKIIKSTISNYIESLSDSSEKLKSHIDDKVNAIYKSRLDELKNLL